MPETPDTPALPTPEEEAAARDLLLRAAAGRADPSQAVMLALVTSEPFGATLDMMVEAQVLNRSDAELAYAISMFERMRAKHAPA